MGLSLRAYARSRAERGLAGGHDSAVRKAIQSGRITPEPDGTIDPAKADAQWERNTNKAYLAPRDGAKAKPSAAPVPAAAPASGSVMQRAGSAAPSGEALPAATYSTARAVKERFLAQLARLDFEERTGKLVPAEQVGNKLFECGRTARDKLLAVPGQLSGLLVGRDEDEIQSILDAEFRRVLSELADDLARVARA